MSLPICHSLPSTHFLFHALLHPSANFLAHRPKPLSRPPLHLCNPSFPMLRRHDPCPMLEISTHRKPPSQTPKLPSVPSTTCTLSVAKSLQSLKSPPSPSWSSKVPNKQAPCAIGINTNNSFVYVNFKLASYHHYQIG